MGYSFPTAEELHVQSGLEPSYTTVQQSVENLRGQFVNGHADALVQFDEGIGRVLKVARCYIDHPNTRKSGVTLLHRGKRTILASLKNLGLEEDVANMTTDQITNNILQLVGYEAPHQGKKSASR